MHERWIRISPESRAVDTDRMPSRTSLRAGAVPGCLSSSRLIAGRRRSGAAGASRLRLAMCPVLLLWGALLLQGGLEDLDDLVFDGVAPQRTGAGDPHGGGKVPSQSSNLPVSTALAGSARSEVGRQAWPGLAALARRPFRRGTVPEPAGTGLPPGQLRRAGARRATGGQHRSEPGAGTCDRYAAGRSVGPSGRPRVTSSASGVNSGSHSFPQTHRTRCPSSTWATSARN